MCALLSLFLFKIEFKFLTAHLHLWTTRSAWPADTQNNSVSQPGPTCCGIKQMNVDHELKAPTTVVLTLWTMLWTQPQWLHWHMSIISTRMWLSCKPTLSPLCTTPPGILFSPPGNSWPQTSDAYLIFQFPTLVLQISTTITSDKFTLSTIMMIHLSWGSFLNLDHNFSFRHRSASVSHIHITYSSWYDPTGWLGVKYQETTNIFNLTLDQCLWLWIHLDILKYC